MYGFINMMYISNQPPKTYVYGGFRRNPINRERFSNHGKWTRRDLNPESPPCKGGAIFRFVIQSTGLCNRPVKVFLFYKKIKKEVIQP